jgi:hypothetical protein
LSALVSFTSVLFLLPLALPALCSPVDIAAGAFLLNGILTPVFPQLYAISLTDICVADGANGLANIYWVNVKKLPD